MEIYQAFLANLCGGAPRLYKSLKFQGNVYLLTEFVEGRDLRRCDRKCLISVLNALIYLQNQYWERVDLQNAGFGFAASLLGREKRGYSLGDADLERAYERFLQIYAEIPRTLCHDDLLPFNVLLFRGPCGTHCLGICAYSALSHIPGPAHCPRGGGRKCFFPHDPA